MIRFDRFTKRFGDLLAVDALELALAPGETLAVIGPNGSGKTTSLKAVVGLVRPSAGRVTVAGLDAAGDPAARARVGYLPQRLSFPEGMSGREAIRFYARLRGAPLSEADALLERVGLADAAHRTADAYSGGMRQRLGLAVALLGRPEALVLDEPSAALDPTGALLVRDLIRAIRADGTTVLLSSHDLGEVAALADRVAIFAGGRLRALGTPAELERALPVTVFPGAVPPLEAVYRAHTFAAKEAA
jgi:Cu-processing system ATP-binding protein